jgi:Domain of unknown function (DUF4795)
MAAIILDPTQLVDLALGTPEVGAVNFKLLHSLLHVMINRMNMAGTRIELSGEQCATIEQMARNHLRQDQDPKLLEYSIIDPSLSLGYTNRESRSMWNLAPPKTVVVVGVGDADNPPEIVDLSRPFCSTQAPATVTVDEFQSLKSAVNEIRGSLLSNSTSAQLEALTKRIGDVEQMIQKLAILANDLAREHTLIEKNVLPYLDGGDISNLLAKMDEVQRIVFETTGKIVKVTETEPRLASFNNDQEVNPNRPAPGDIPTIKPRRISLQRPSMMAYAALLEQVQALKAEFDYVKEQLTAAHPEGCRVSISIPTLPLGHPADSLLDVVAEKVDGLETNAINVERQISELLDTLRTLDEKQQERFGSKMVDLMAELAFTKVGVEKLWTEKDRIDSIVNEALIDIRLMKDRKINAEDVERLLTEKLDVDMMATIVTKAEMEEAMLAVYHRMQCVENAVGNTDAGLEQMCGDLADSVAAKLDKSEFDDLRNAVNEKLQIIKSRLLALDKEQQRKDAEGAATKTKFLRDLNCISCDNDVIMKMQQEMVPKVPEMSATRTIKPKLVYKLDNIRQKLRNFPGTQLDLAQSGQFQNRYCGGNHTKMNASDVVNKCIGKKKLVGVEGEKNGE